MTTILTITAAKGGVTKTTTAVTLAHALTAHAPTGVLLVDTDPQGHCALSLGMDPEPCLFNLLTADPATVPQAFTNNRRATGRPGLWLIPSNTKTKQLRPRLALDALPDEHPPLDLCPLVCPPAGAPLIACDFVVFDTAASGLLQESAIRLADVLILPTALDNLAMDGLAALLAVSTRLNPTARRLILPTLYQKQSLYEHNLQLLHQTYPAELLPAVPHCAAVREATANGQTLWEYHDRHSRTLPAVHCAYEQIIATILDKVQTEPTP